MKKIVNVNIGGIPFTLDDDAYEILNQYLTTIHEVYHGEDDDVTSDIETRLAERLLQDVNEGRIVTRRDIETEISVIGDPHSFEQRENDAFETESTAAAFQESEEIGNHADAADESGSGCTPQGGSAERPIYPPQEDLSTPRIEHRLFRDGRNKMIAGVCSGLAAYGHLSVSMVRFLAVLIFLLSLSNDYSPWIVPFIYIAFWIALPEARTPLQYMQLYGEKPSMSNIGKAVSETVPPAYRPSGHNGNQNDRFWNNLWGVLVAIFKAIFLLTVIVVAIPLIMGLVLALVAIIAAACGAGIASTAVAASLPFHPELLTDLITGTPWEIAGGIVASIACIAAIIIPIGFIIRAIFKIDSKSPLSYRTRITWLIVWIACIVIAGAIILAFSV